MSSINIVCATCGSEDVLADAYAAWNKTTQAWELSTTFDKGSVCEACGGECRLKEVSLPAPPTPPGRTFTFMSSSAMWVLEYSQVHVSPDECDPEGLLLDADEEYERIAWDKHGDGDQQYLGFDIGDSIASPNSGSSGIVSAAPERLFNENLFKKG